MIALFRIAKQGTATIHLLAGMLLAVTIAAMFFLARWEVMQPFWSLLFTGGHTIVWIADLIFLLAYARRDESARAIV